MQAISFSGSSVGLSVVLRGCCRDEGCRGTKNVIGSGEKCDSRGDSHIAYLACHAVTYVGVTYVNVTYVGMNCGNVHV